MICSFLDTIKINLSFTFSAEEEKDSDNKIRRTERIRRERPDFFNALEVANQFKKKRKRKEVHLLD